MAGRKDLLSQRSNASRRRLVIARELEPAYACQNLTREIRRVESAVETIPGDNLERLDMGLRLLMALRSSLWDILCLPKRPTLRTAPAMRALPTADVELLGSASENLAPTPESDVSAEDKP